MTDKKRIPRTPAEPLAYIGYVLRHCPTKMKVHAGLACFFESAAVACDMMVAWSLGRIIEVILKSGDKLWEAMPLEIYILAGLWTARNIFFRTRGYFERQYAPVLMNVTRELLFHRLIQQSQTFLHNNFAGVLANHVRRAGDVMNALREKVQSNFLPLIIRFLTAGVLLWQITPLFVLFIMFFLVVGIVCSALTAKRWTQLSTTEAEASSRLTGFIVDSTTNVLLVKQNVGWPKEQKNLVKVHDSLTQAYNKRSVFGAWFWGTFDAVMTLFYCGFMLLLAYSFQQGTVTTAQIAMTVGIITNLFGAIAQTIYLLSAKFDDVGILRDALHKISTPLSIYDVPDAPDLNVAQGHIELRDVTFRYSDGSNLFSNLSLDIPPGQKVGLVGVSGAGKTTLCQLLLRTYDVTDGGIYIDGQNIAEVTQDSLHASIAVIPQEPTLFHRTLGENIRYGRHDATEEEVRAAAKAAAVDGFIESLPLGYNTLVGERGIKLSGGQRQRIAIARAIVKNSALLVLDEATSALDSETEKSIQAAMAEAMKGRTTLVIAHRLSTLSNMDRIIVMDGGRIIEDGSFDELMAKKGHFSMLWSLQAGGFLPEHMPHQKQ